MASLHGRQVGFAQINELLLDGGAQMTLRMPGVHGSNGFEDTKIRDDTFVGGRESSKDNDSVSDATDLTTLRAHGPRT